MSNAVIPLDNLSTERRAQLRQLTTAPRIAWPTVILCAAQIGTFLLVYWFCAIHLWPLWLGTLLNSVAAYLAFSTGHDAVHRAISTNVRFNDLVGEISLGLVLPYVDIRMFRWAHSLHHRFANDPRDPDVVLHGPWWSLPFRWMSIDLLYVIHAFRHGDKVSTPFLHASLRRAVIVAAVIATLCWAGYGKEVLMLWFIPSRVGLMALGFAFFWLPHVPHDVTQAENFTRATTIREGYEWLFDPVLQYQNFHLIHHIYPATPFYNNAKVFRLVESELRKHDLAIQHGFAIRPTIHPGIRTSSTFSTGGSV
jgi:beta-carotene hydroxylase